MMSEKRFIVESVSIIDDCNEDKSRITKVITDKEELYSYEDLYEVAELLNEQQFKITELEIELTDCKNRKEQSEYNLYKKIRELENQFEKIPPKIRELWVE